MITIPRSKCAVCGLLLGSLWLAGVLPSRGQSPGSQGNNASSNAGGGAQTTGNSSASTSAATSTRDGSRDPSDNGKSADVRDVAFRRDLADAKGFAKSNNIAAAELALTKSNSFQKDTPEWHFETTQKLLQTANDLSKEGKGTAVRALATQSLQRLNDAATASKDNAVKAKAKADSAFIHDRYMGDPTTAIASYKAALQLAPTDKNVKEALERLEKADANLRAKIRGTKK